MSFIGEVVLPILVRILGWIVLYLLILPILYVLATPVILIGALFGKERYSDKVRSGYQRVADIWLGFGSCL